MAICKPMTVINKIRGHLDAIIRAIVISVAIVVAWNVPYAWYWRVVAFVAIMFIVGIIYPTVQFELAKPLGIKNMPLDNPNSLSTHLLARVLGIAMFWGAAWAIGWLAGSNLTFYLIGVLGTIVVIPGIIREISFQRGTGSAKLFGRKDRFDDAAKLRFAIAIAEMLEIQMILATGKSIEDEHGRLKRKALGYVYGVHWRADYVPGDPQTLA
jgi:hypothetical protein